MVKLLSLVTHQKNYMILDQKLRLNLRKVNMDILFSIDFHLKLLYDCD